MILDEGDYARRVAAFEGPDIRPVAVRIPPEVCAATYCRKATEWVKANGHEPWAHVFVPDDEVAASRLFADYVAMFSVRE